MQLVNKTSLAARCFVTRPPDSGEGRELRVVAKATYSFGTDGSLQLDTDDPLPVLDNDRQSPFGLLPRDDMLADGRPVFEVVLLGSAHAPGGRAVTEMPVALTVGERRRALRVIGDRCWVTDPGGQTEKTAPEPFVRMPLTWERAHGGTATVLMDEDAPMDLYHQINPVGRGFDPLPAAQQMAEGLGLPDGYPSYPGKRLLPNIEHPDRLVASPQDDPEPVCWETLPPTSPLHLVRQAELVPPPQTLQELMTAALERDLPDLQLPRAHPDWVLPRPEQDLPLLLEGMSPQSPRLQLTVPLLRVEADVTDGLQDHRLTLTPRMLILVLECSSLCMVYTCQAFIAPPGSGPRRVRLRMLEAGDDGRKR